MLLESCVSFGQGFIQEQFALPFSVSKSFFLVQREFSEFLSPDDYRDVMKREDLFQRYLGLYLQGQNTAKDDKPDKPVSLTRLTR